MIMIALNKSEVESVYTTGRDNWIDVRAGMKNGLPLVLATFAWKANEQFWFKPSIVDTESRDAAHAKADALVIEYSSLLGLVNME